MEPVTLGDIGLFMQNIINVFDSYIIFAFSMMIAFSVLIGIRKLIIGGKI